MNISDDVTPSPVDPTPEEVQFLADRTYESIPANGVVARYDPTC